ncbi:MAG: tetratricopeptide repeat protein [Candidatus Omnitrophica bacterium]|nr:tetratricopeptide repeat protein [Candidatus Omnitrophota bacterium]
MEEKEAHYHRGVTLYGQEDINGALAEYERALEMDPHYVDALLGAAVACDRTGRLDHAVAFTLRAVRIDPENLLAHTSLSLFFQKLGMTRSAEETQSVARILAWKEEARVKRESPPQDTSGESPFNIL